MLLTLVLFGINIYKKQLGPIGEQIINHYGPVIMAGYFNACMGR